VKTPEKLTNHLHTTRKPKTNAEAQAKPTNEFHRPTNTATNVEPPGKATKKPGNTTTMLSFHGKQQKTWKYCS
jgi:hypothetical protein